MSRYIDVDKLTYTLGASDEDIYFKAILEETPTIDAVSVVRCKDCRYKDMELCAMYKLVVAGVRKYDDFCSYGERKIDHE